MNDLRDGFAYLWRMKTGFRTLAQCSGCRIGGAPFAGLLTIFVLAGRAANSFPHFSEKTSGFVRLRLPRDAAASCSGDHELSQAGCAFFAKPPSFMGVEGEGQCAPMLRPARAAQKMLSFGRFFPAVDHACCRRRAHGAVRHRFSSDKRIDSDIIKEKADRSVG